MKLVQKYWSTPIESHYYMILEIYSSTYMTVRNNRSKISNSQSATSSEKFNCNKTIIVREVCLDERYFFTSEAYIFFKKKTFVLTLT